MIGDNYDQSRSTFVLAFQEGSILEDKIRRICQSFVGSTFDVQLDTLEKDLDEARSNMLQVKEVIKHTKQIYKQYLVESNTRAQAEVSVFNVYKLFILREKSIYTHLNMLRSTNMISHALIWVPRSFKFEKKIKDIITQYDLVGLNYEKGPRKIEGLEKPTLFKTNEFTSGFQLIVDTYGVPTYKEVNPAIFACVSFPFFVGVMFGDIMHGAILTVFGMYLCLGKREKGNLVDMAAPVRYMILLIGVFSFYCGFIYNDFTSLATAVFPTCYETNANSEKVAGSPGMVYATPKDKDCVYPIGIDHVWYRSPLELNVMNGLKMKTSVIYGVAQMLLGTGLKGLNAIYFGRWVELLFVVTG